MPLYDVSLDCGLYLSDRYTPRSPDGVIHYHIAEDGTMHRCSGSLGVGSRPPSTGLPVHPSESVVVWSHPRHGIRYPGRNDVPMPPQYRRWGFERREIRTVHELAKFERQNKVCNEKLNYDSNGKADRE